MHPGRRTEARLDGSNNLLVASSTWHDDDLSRDFCGSVVTPDDLSSGSVDIAGKTVYLCGDLSGIGRHDLDAAARVLVVREPPHDVTDGGSHLGEIVDPGRVPVRVHGAGVYYRRFFDPRADHFARIRAEHEFQSLTESTKPGTAHRTGIYLTPVRRDADELHFRLLRCSTNLSGPTENFRATDTQIVDALNDEAAFVLRNQARLNHVLAQIYHNTPGTAGRRPSKAKISAHADKTKDMPGNGIIAFCTFYDRLDGLRPLGAFDHGLNGVSGLTRLHFRLKEPAGEAAAESDAEPALPATFTLPLYPGSVFLMPLSTNRLYTHEIRSSALAAELLPTRLGYVVRCSNAEAVHRDDRTFLKTDGALAELEPPTPEGLAELRTLYAEENRTRAFVDYPDTLRFSMNTGDYRAPRT